MSLAITLANAAAGLAAGRGMGATTSENVAGAEVDGFVRRDATLSFDGIAVRADSPRAALDPYLLRDQRNAMAAAAGADVRAARLDDVARITGEAAGGFSLSSALAELESAFLALEAEPASAGKQRNTLAAAQSVVDAFAAADSAITEARQRAHEELEADIASANRSLARIEALNGQIASAEAVGADANALRDERDAQLDGLAQLLPIATHERADGRVVIAVKGGPTLLDETMRPIASGAAVIPPGAAPGYPTYPSLRVDDPNAPAIATDLSNLSEGRLGGALLARDQDLIQAQRELDGLAQGVIQAFQNADATLGPAAAGLFTNAGAPVDPAVTESLGLAGRLTVNPAVDPDQGGALRRLRDGVGSAVAGPSQGSEQIRAFLGAFQAATPFPAAAGLSATASILDFATEMAGARNAARTGLQADAQAQSAVAATLATERATQGGVDLDAEARRLMELEQYYAANAQVIDTARRLLDELLAAVRR